MTVISDIIPHAVVLKVANNIAKSMRKFAKQAGSKRIPKAIKVGKVNATSITATIGVTINTKIAPHAFIFDKGAREHSIDAKNAPYLVFEGTNGFEGIVKVAHVDHPGMEARPYIAKGKNENREKNKKIISEAVGRNIRLQIRTYKIK